MTTLNIPSSPSQGATYEANGVVYTWDGTKWKADSSNVSNLNGGQLAGFRNQIINGDFRIWQRGPTFAAGTDQVYTSDRWFAVKGSRPGSISKAAVSGIPNCAYAATIDMEQFYNNIELETPGTGSDARFRNGMQYTLSFWSNAPVVNAQLVYRQGTSTPAADQAAADPAITANGDLQPVGSAIGSFQKYSHTFTINSQSAANHTTLAVLLYNNTGAYSLTGVQLEPGPVATPFENRPVGTELALCQRYYETSANIIFLQKTGVTGTTNSLTTNVYLKVNKRDTPTITLLGGSNVSGLSALSFSSGAASSFVISGTATDASASARCNGYTADAEL